MNDYKEIKLNENIVLEEVPNKDIRIYHIKSKLTNETMYNINSSEINSIQNQKIKILLKSIFNMDGIISLTVEKYSVSVEIGKAFDYENDSIQNKIIILLNDYIINNK